MRDRLSCVWRSAALFAAALPFSAIGAAAPPTAELPSWLKFSGDVAARADLSAATDFEAGNFGRSILSHLRFRTDVTAQRWLLFSVELHDARSAGTEPETADSVANHFDIRQAWTQVGNAERGWSLRAGRQELAFGDERLIGADSYWDNLGHTFDAARLSMRGGRCSFDWFAAMVGEPVYNRLDALRTDQKLFGIYTSCSHRHGVLEPYALFRTIRASSPNGGQDLRTYGMHTTGKGPLRTDFNVEVSVQNGTSDRLPVRAWAGHWELGYRAGEGEDAPRIAIDFNHASGDSNPADGRHHTFDDLYSAGYNDYGLPDIFGARNLRDIGAHFEWSVTKRWTLVTGVRRFRLSTVQDGLYTDGQHFLAWNTEARSSDVGSQASLSVACELAAEMRLHAGIASFLPGAYLKQSGFSGNWTTPYVAWMWHF